MEYELSISMFPEAIELDTKDMCEPGIKCYRHPKFMRLMPKFGFFDADQYESVVFVNDKGVIMDWLNFQSSPAYQEFITSIPGVYR